MEREEGRRCKIVARSRSITFVCGSTRVHTRSIRAGSIDRSIDRRIIEPTVPCNIVSGGSERETKEEKAEGERGAFRFQAYFITKPQFQPGFAVVSRRREREGGTRRKEGRKKRNRGRGKAVVVRSARTRLPARSPRDLAPLAEFSTLAIDVT